MRARLPVSGAKRPRGETVRTRSRPRVLAYLAVDDDGGAIDAYEEIAVVEQLAPRTVLVTRLHEPSEA